jgi:DNA invertase Pin-like site-specific DNA recombinase
LGQRAALYCRVSTADQTCERQEADLRAFAAKAGFDVWGRSTIDLFHSLGELQAWGISLIAQTGLQFDLGTPQGKLIASLMSVLAEFERDLLRERVRSGIAAAQARGVRFGRQPGQRVKADRHQKRALELVAAGQSYREIGLRLGISKNTVLDIVKRDRAKQATTG